MRWGSTAGACTRISPQFCPYYMLVVCHRVEITGNQHCHHACSRDTAGPGLRGCCRLLFAQPLSFAFFLASFSFFNLTSGASTIAFALPRGLKSAWLPHWSSSSRGLKNLRSNRSSLGLSFFLFLTARKKPEKTQDGTGGRKGDPTLSTLPLVDVRKIRLL